VEPIYHRAVYNGREFSGPDSQCGADRGEAQYYPKLSADAIDEELPAILTCVQHACTFYFIADSFINEVCLFIYFLVNKLINDEL